MHSLVRRHERWILPARRPSLLGASFSGRSPSQLLRLHHDAVIAEWGVVGDRRKVRAPPPTGIGSSPAAQTGSSANWEATVRMRAPKTLRKRHWSSLKVTLTTQRR